MTDYVLEQSNNENLEKHLSNKNGHDFMNYWHSVFSYAKFLKQPLKLGMFVPCDENDVPIINPFCENAQCVDCDCLYVWEQAKERVLFEGFELIKIGENYWTFKINGIEFNLLKDFTIEDLQQNFFDNEIELTESAIKNL